VVGGGGGGRQVLRYFYLSQKEHGRVGLAGAFIARTQLDSRGAHFLETPPKVALNALPHLQR
jgi:hypothetical protein